MKKSQPNQKQFAQRKVCFSADETLKNISQDFKIKQEMVWRLVCCGMHAERQKFYVKMTAEDFVSGFPSDWFLSGKRNAE